MRSPCSVMVAVAVTVSERHAFNVSEAMCGCKSGIVTNVVQIIASRRCLVCFVYCVQHMLSSLLCCRIVVCMPPNKLGRRR
ncbi:hypothetical protein BKA63DRAFT_520607 [Paraphoma chrysanthemicola]|nr:hypothetical protein BKA63DRAFT_520607 [Paraphoma chrysanthemicola]